MVTVKVFVEGGGQDKSLKVECRKGFSEFFKKAGFAGHMPRVVACGSRNDAFDSFCTACANGESAVLLVDSEDKVTADSVWAHLTARDGWQPPTSVDSDRAHLMVVVMETWFLADKPALARFFGQGFNADALPKNPNVEDIAKRDIYAGLERATKATKSKGTYGKGAHSFKLLQTIDPDLVKAASRHAADLLNALTHLLHAN